MRFFSSPGEVENGLLKVDCIVRITLRAPWRVPVNSMMSGGYSRGLGGLEVAILLNADAGAAVLCSADFKPQVTSVGRLHHE